MKNIFFKNICKILILLVIMFNFINSANAIINNNGSVGIILNENKIVGLLLNSPAYNTGIKVGDKLVKVDNVDTRYMSSADIDKLLTGNINTSVEISTERGLEIINYQLTRKDSSFLKLNVPRWEEFCPHEYVNVQQVEEIKESIKPAICQLETPIAKILREMTFLPTLYCGINSGLNKLNNTSNKLKAINTYWFERRNAFQNELLNCYANPEEQLSCFAKVRESENIKNYNLLQEKNSNGLNTLNFHQF